MPAPRPTSMASPPRPCQTIAIDLPGQRYPIHIGAGLVASLATLIRPHLAGGPLLVVADERVSVLHGPAVLTALADLGVPVAMATFLPGETSKTLATAERLWQACATHRIDRTGCIIALGGGVCGDLAGFVASAWMRGIAFIQIPTTLLAMVDSSVGGKTGVNCAAGKNLVGAFKQPSCVVIDTGLLGTMDGREYRAGLAEVLKYGIIRSAEFLAWQERHGEALAAGDPSVVIEAVATSCGIKAAYVAADERELGIRAHLNYGHTFAHALERETGYGRYLHGEAVAIGMRMAADLARRIGLLADPDLARRQDALLRLYRLPLAHLAPRPADEAERLTGHCRLDKKVAAGRMRFILPRRVGEVEVFDCEDIGAITAAFESAITTTS